MCAYGNIITFNREYKKYTNITFDYEPSGKLKIASFGEEITFSPLHDVCSSADIPEFFLCKDFWCIYEYCLGLPRQINPIIRIAMPEFHLMYPFMN